MTPENPVFRSRYSLGIEKVKALSVSSIIQVIYRVLNKAGLRQNFKNNRYEVQLDHGFRKRFNTILKLNREINPNIAEKLMGHSKGLDGAYLKPTPQECFDEYKKDIPTPYWHKDKLKQRFETKYQELLYVKADSRGRGATEEFHFNEAWLMKGFDFANFVKLLEEGTILVDIRIGQYEDGRPHDRGTGFRVFPNKLDLCFSHRTKVI